MKIDFMFLDIDGTLVDSCGNISFYTKNVLKKCELFGIKIVLISGRSFPDLMRLMDELGINAILVSDNGSIIYDSKNDKFFKKLSISKSLVIKIFDICKKFKIDSIFNSISKRYRLFFDLNKDEKESYDLEVSDFSSICENCDEIFQIVLLSFDKSRFLSAVNELSGMNISINNLSIDKSVINLMDIDNINSSKGNAIDIIFKYFNSKNNSSICFGDGINDVSMFEKCKYKVAMKNGVSSLKRNASYITKFDNNENGVANFILEYLTFDNAFNDTKS